MSMLPISIEFFAFENEIWYRLDDGTTARLTESDIDMVAQLFSIIEEFYTKAFNALCKEYEACAPNIPYYRFRVVSRFLKCNFAPLDNTPDLVNGKFRNFEYVPCPLRGECRGESVICRPEFNHNLSDAELRVMRLWFQGESEDVVADLLCLSPHTVHNHIRNAYFKTKVRSRAEFVKYAETNRLFP